MSSLKRAKSAMVLATLLSLGGAAPSALAAQETASAQQRALGIVALRTAADGAQTRIILEGTAELPYTIYRPDERTLLVDLPGVDAAKLNDSYAVGSAAVERIQVERLRTASGQSLARLRVRLTAVAEERTVVEGNNLVVTLTGAAPAVQAPVAPAATRADEPVAMQAEARPVAAKPAPVKAPAKVEAPMAPATPATVITGVRTDVADGKFRAVIATDGRAPFKHFVLPDPDRIVLDVTGVRSGVERNSVEVNGGGISRIRIGQFRTADPRIVRIVFDVAKMGPYTVQQVGTDLVLTLGEKGGVDVGTPAAAVKTEKPVVSQPKPVVPPMRRPVVGDDEESTKAPAPKPVARPAAKPVEAPAKPAAEPARVVPPASIPTRPVSDETIATAAPAATAPRQNTSRALQGRPPAPAVPSSTQGGYGTEGFVGRVIDFDLKNVDLRDLLRFLHAQVGVNFIVDQGVQAVPVTLSIRGVPWNVTLDAVLRANNLGAVREGQIIRISTQAGIARERQEALAAEQARFLALPLSTRIFRLKYILAATGGPPIGANNPGGGQTSVSENNPFLRIVRARLSPRGTVEIDPRTNRMIVTDLEPRLAVVEQIVRVLDRPEPQVEIEARIVVARRTFLRDLGVQIAAAAQNRDTGGLVGISTLPGAPTGSGGNQSGGLVFPGTRPGGQASGGNVGDPQPRVPGGLAGGAEVIGTNTVVALTTGVLGTFQISAQLNLSEQKGLARTIASPRVTALNNTQAQIANGVQIPVQTVTNNTVTTTFVTAALRLQITPAIVAEDGAIQLSVLAEQNGVDETIVSLGTPGISTRSASTVVIVPDGGTTIIGGVNIDIENQAETRTPGLARIPIIGNLFKSRRKERDTQEILFFITPRIFRPELVGLPEGSTVRSGDITITPLIPAGSEGGTGAPVEAPEPAGGGQ